MANGEIYEKNLSNASGIGSGDYLRTVNSNNESEKINYTVLAKAIVEQYAGSTLAGSSQSVKSAVDMLNNRSKLNEIYGAGTLTDANNAERLTWYLVFVSASNVPEQGLLFSYGEAGNYYQVLFGASAFYSRRYYNGWSDWAKMSLKREDITVPITVGGISASSRVQKSGGIVTVPISVGSSAGLTSFNSSDIIGTLPEGFRPTGSRYASLSARSDGAWATANYVPVVINAESSGNMKILGNDATIQQMKYITGQIVFPV